MTCSTPAWPGAGFAARISAFTPPMVTWKLEGAAEPFTGGEQRQERSARRRCAGPRCASRPHSAPPPARGPSRPRRISPGVGDVTGTVTGDDAAPRPCTTTCTEEPDNNAGTTAPDLSRRDIQQRRRHAVEQRRLRAREPGAVHRDHFTRRDCSRQIARRIRHRAHRDARRDRRQHAHRVACRVRHINVAVGIRPPAPHGWFNCASSASPPSPE